MWLTDLLHTQPGTRPTRPTSEIACRTAESVTPIGFPTTSDTSDTKQETSTPSGGMEAEQIAFTQVSYKNPGSVRHLPLLEVGSCSKEQRADCRHKPDHCRPDCVRAVPYHTDTDGKPYFVRTVKVDPEIRQLCQTCKHYVKTSRLNGKCAKSGKAVGCGTRCRIGSPTALPRHGTRE